MNSRTKGKAGELEAAHWLTAHGHPARRGQQFAGGNDSPDIVCDSLPSVHFEVKRTETLRLYDAMVQAIIDAGPLKIPVVMHRRNKGNGKWSDWVMIMRAEDAIRLLPKCRSTLDDIAIVSDGCAPEGMVGLPSRFER